MDQPLNPLNSPLPEPPLAIPDSTDPTSPASPEAQSKVDELIRYVNEQIELLAFDETEAPTPALLNQMIQSLEDPRRATRISLVEALSQMGESVMPFLLQALTNHPEPIVRRACCNALTNIGDETSVAGLINALLYDQDISVKSAAAGALAKVGAPAFDAIRGVLASETASESCKGHAAWAMASMSDEITTQLYQSVDDPVAAVRLAVIGAIAQLAQKQLAQKQLAQKQLTPKQLTLQPLTPRPSAEAPLAVNSEPKALALLIQALDDQASDVRIEAAAHLARLNCQLAYQPLVNCLKDADWEVRKAAILALGKLANPDAIAAIAPLQQDSEPAVKQVATLVVEQLTAQTKEQKA